MGHKSGEKVGVSYCHGLGLLLKLAYTEECLTFTRSTGGNQVFAYTKRKQIMSDDNCLDASSSHGPVNLVRCHGMQGNQEWSYDETVS
jgi:polypeptide N-acetylgalactosaminyltransferase